MDHPKTCWILLNEAARGERAARDRFSDLYIPTVRATLTARWRGGPLAGDVDDAVQDVFIECLKDGGALKRATAAEAPSFRAFLFGITRNVARRWEERAGRRRDAAVTRHILLDAAGADEASLSKIFDRQWARALVKRAANHLTEQANASDDKARQRVELLRLRFVEDLPIREIAKRWDTDPARVHHDYARAREEFQRALRDVIALHHPDEPRAVERELREVFSGLG